MLSLIFSFFILVFSFQIQGFTGRYFSLRSVAMGGAYSAMVEGSESLLFNPAQLAFENELSWNLFEIDIGLNGQETLAAMDQISGPLSENINNLFGERVWVAGGGKSILAFPHFALGAFDTAVVDLKVSNPTFPQVEGGISNEYGFILGGGFLLDKNLSLGFSLRRLIRQETKGPFSMGELLGEGLSLEYFKTEGVGFGADLGLLYQVGETLKSRWSLVWQNVGGTSFKSLADKETPQFISQDFILGGAFGLQIDFFSIMSSIELRHLQNMEMSLGKKFHMGLEVKLPALTLRGGFSQGYYSWGGEFDLWLMSINFANYGYELGEALGQREGRHWALSLGTELSFDTEGFYFKRRSKEGFFKQRR